MGNKKFVTSENLCMVHPCVCVPICLRNKQAVAPNNKLIPTDNWLELYVSYS